jgi:hypothetical protein
MGCTLAATTFTLLGWPGPCTNCTCTKVVLARTKNHTEDAHGICKVSAPPTQPHCQTYRTPTTYTALDIIQAQQLRPTVQRQQCVKHATGQPATVQWRQHNPLLLLLLRRRRRRLLVDGSLASSCCQVTTANAAAVKGPSADTS